MTMAASRDARGRFVAKAAEALTPAYRHRIERGARRGQALRASRGHGVRAQPMWRSGAAVEKATYRKALTVLSRMRHGESLYGAARAEHTTPDAVQRQVGAALSRDQRGRYVAAPSDRYVRRMKFLDARGIVVVEPVNSREASKLAAYWVAVDHYLRTGDDRLLRAFRRKLLRVRGKIQLPFVTDLDTLDHLARAGELSFEDLYELAA
jgi:hypothetical protein